MDLRHSGRRDLLHRVHFPTQGALGDGPVDRASGETPEPEDRTHGPGELFTVYRHHAVFTNSAEPVLIAEAHHRDHAIVEQVIADLKTSPLKHFPSGRYDANGAWLSCAVIAYNLARAVGTLARGRHTKPRTATIRARLINTPARIAFSASTYTLHLPANSRRQTPFMTMFNAVQAPPRAA